LPVSSNTASRLGAGEAMAVRLSDMATIRDCEADHRAELHRRLVGLLSGLTAR